MGGTVIQLRRGPVLAPLVDLLLMKLSLTLLPIRKLAVFSCLLVTLLRSISILGWRHQRQQEACDEADQRRHPHPRSRFFTVPSTPWLESPKSLLQGLVGVT